MRADSLTPLANALAAFFPRSKWTEEEVNLAAEEIDRFDLDGAQIEAVVRAYRLKCKYPSPDMSTLIDAMKCARSPGEGEQGDTRTVGRFRRLGYKGTDTEVCVRGYSDMARMRAEGESRHGDKQAWNGYGGDWRGDRMCRRDLGDALRECRVSNWSEVADATFPLVGAEVPA